MARVKKAMTIDAGTFELVWSSETDGPPARGIRVKNLVTSGESVEIYCAGGLHGDDPAEEDEGFPLDPGESWAPSSMLPHGSGGSITKVWARSDGADIAFTVDLT